MHITVGHARSMGGDNPPEGTLSEDLWVFFGDAPHDDEERELILVIAQPNGDGSYTFQIDAQPDDNPSVIEVHKAEPGRLLFTVRRESDPDPGAEAEIIPLRPRPS
jgi:hypothetical protein